MSVEQARAPTLLDQPVLGALSAADEVCLRCKVAYPTFIRQLGLRCEVMQHNHQSPSLCEVELRGINDLCVCVCDAVL